MSRTSSLKMVSAAGEPLRFLGFLRVLRIFRILLVCGEFLWEFLCSRSRRAFSELRCSSEVRVQRFQQVQMGPGGCWVDEAQCYWC